MNAAQSWSLGEVRSLAVKAARGFDMAWGLAEEAGFAVEWLEARGHPGVAALARYFQNCETFDNATCPISLGAAISDQASPDQLLPAEVVQPVLLVPFLAAIVGDRTLQLNVANLDTGVRICPQGVVGNIDGMLKFGAVVQCSLSSAEPISEEIACVDRVSGEREPAIRTLEHFAHKTYAPATEESRAKGAGAGTTDND